GLTIFNGLKLEDGTLTGSDFANSVRNLHCSIFTLSACSTFKIYTTDQSLGIVGSILGVGAKSVLTSLWPTPDEATFMLMKEFYKNIKVLNKVKALQKAQVKVRRKYSQHPFLWAPFILVGAVN
ncbi:MAG: hypothetical protein QG670_1951, partial [Thermoproteota archaeon]|nr:hypothetical protein [Thermoproteota archaeon]